MVILLYKNFLTHYNLKTAQDLYYLIATEKLELLEIKDVLLKDEITGEAAPQLVLTEKEIKEQI